MHLRYVIPMKQETKKSKITQRRWRTGTRFPGIVEHARQLGVTRVHLYMVLSGARVSRSLMRRYAAINGGAR